MSHSVSPLGSLSSPSPSPPPNPIDESELSELTDDDHDPKNDVNNNHSDSDQDNQDDDDDPPPRTRKSITTPSVNTKPRQRKNVSRKSASAVASSSRTANASSASKRKKRGGLVPAPMWDWAYKNGSSGPPTSTPTPGQSLSPKTNPISGASPSGPADTASDSGLNHASRTKSASATPDAEEEEEEELPAPPRAMEEEEGEEADARKDRLDDNGKRQSRPTYPIKRRRKKIVVPMPFDPNKVPRSKRGIRFMPKINVTQNNAALKSLWESGLKIYDPNAPTSDEEEEQDDDADVKSDEEDESDSEVSDPDEMDVDENGEEEEASAYHSPIRPSLITNLKRKSPHPISAADPGVDQLSVPPSVRASAEPTTSPPDEDVNPEVIPDEDLDNDNDPEAPEDHDANPAPDGDMEVDADEDDAPPEEPSQPPSPTPLAEPEPEAEDEDPDLQPAHRAEALDVLATIELKFALLRERVYVEKMDGLAWEETLVWDGTHPELHHLQNELTKRRDKRLMLASKKRVYEIEAATRKRKEEETWCWQRWEIARTELQTEMIAETNRKRRKLERDRRTIERPPGARRIPHPILNPPPAPTLRQIANIFPLPSHLSHLATNKRLSSARGFGVSPGLDAFGGATAHPDLPTLSPHEIAADLEFLFQHRRMGYGFGMGFGPAMGVGIGYNGVAPGFGPGTIGLGGPSPNSGFGVNGLGIGGPMDGYPPNPGPGIPPGGNPAQVSGAGGSLALSGPRPSPPSTAPPQIIQDPSVGPGNLPGPGIANPDGPSFSQPAMGVFQGLPSIGGGPTSYPLGPGGGGTSIVIGPGGATSTPNVGPGGARIPRSSGFAEREREMQRDREREMLQRDREMRERELTPRDRELAAQREREMREREFMQRERERELGPNMGPGYPPWNSKPVGGMDWGVGDARRRDEEQRMERNERDRSQAQPIVPTPTHRHLHHPHPHSHTHQLHPHNLHPTPHPHQPHPSHAHPSHGHQHSQHQHSHPHQHSASHAQPHHHVTQHHHRHHHHVVHHHHPSGPGSGANSSGPDGASPTLGQGPGSGPASGVQTMEIINLSANLSSKSHWKREEGKLGGTSMPGSRPSSTHPLPASHSYDERERERERERDRPIATPFVLAPSHHTISSNASSPRHGWTSGPNESGPSGSSGPSAPFPLLPERYHSPVPHRFPNPTSNGQLPRPLTTSPPRAPPTSSTSPSMSALNAPLPSSSSAAPFPLARKPSPALPKLGMAPLVFSPRLAGPGVVPPTGPGVPGVLSTTPGPGVTPSGILTSGPGVPPGPGIAPAPVESGLSSIFGGGRTTSPLIALSSPRGGPPPTLGVATQKVSVDGP